MLKLQEYRNTAKGLPDLLTYACLIDKGIVLQKDGSFLASWEFTGLDTASATFDELSFMCGQVSNAIKLLGTGFMLHVDAIRSTKKAYPNKDKGFFPDKISQMIDDERREYFGSDLCYSTSTFLTLTYKPEFSIANKNNEKFLEKSLEYFKLAILEIESSLSVVLFMNRLQEYELFHKNGKILHSDLLAHLRQCIDGELNPFAVPNVPMYLDALLGSEDLINGTSLIYGNKYISVISVDGLPQESYPAMLSHLLSVPCEYRFSTRYICLDQYHAEKEIDTYIKGWNQKVYRFIDQMINNPNAKVNRDALSMRENAEIAKEEVQSGLLGAGYISTTFILMGQDKEQLQQNTREIKRILQTLGFSCRIETINALEAFLGSLAGNSYANIRRPMVTSINLADFLPLSTIYTGQSSNPSPFFPPNSRPLAVVTTENGSSPFWLNLHVGDLGHTLIFGPTGSGKSTLLGFIACQFRAYKNAKIYAFDKGMSLFPLCTGVGGSHFEIGGNKLAFAPLQRIDESQSEMIFAEEWILTILELQGIKVLPLHRNEVHEAMLKIRSNPPIIRSLTDFCHVVQSREIKEALIPYTTSGALGNLLDAEIDSLSLADFVVFETEELMNLGDKNLIPVLLYLFHRIEKALTGKPTLLILDEAWILLSDKVFRAKIREWLKVLRKSNCAVVIATQSLSDAKNSGIMDVLAESCPTKILLANQNARQEDQYELYKGIGLNDREINILAQEAIPKRDYYISSPQGKRLVQLALGQKTLAFIGASDKESIKRIKHLQSENENWQDLWLAEKTS